MKLTLKQGDTRHAIRATLMDVNKNPIDLTDAEVIFKMSNRFYGVLINRKAVNETDGKVHFVFQSGDTDKYGLYEAEFLVTYADGRVESFPHKGKIKIYIENRIGGI